MDRFMPGEEELERVVGKARELVRDCVEEALADHLKALDKELGQYADYDLYWVRRELEQVARDSVENAIRRAS